MWICSRLTQSAEQNQKIMLSFFFFIIAPNGKISYNEAMSSHLHKKENSLWHIRVKTQVLRFLNQTTFLHCPTWTPLNFVCQVFLCWKIDPRQLQHVYVCKQLVTRFAIGTILIKGLVSFFLNYLGRIN